MEGHDDVAPAAGHIARVERYLQIALGKTRVCPRPLPGDAVAHEDGRDAGGNAEQQGLVAREVPDRRRPGLVDRLGRYSPFISGIHVGNGCSHRVGSAERKRRVPANAVGERGHGVSLLGALSHERRHIGAAPRDGTRRIAVGNIRGVSDADEAARHCITYQLSIKSQQKTASVYRMSNCITYQLSIKSQHKRTYAVLYEIASHTN